MSGDPRAEAYAADAERLAHDAELPVVAARVARFRSWLARFRGDPEPMEAAARRMLASSEVAGDRQAVVNARRALGEALIDQGRFVEADEALASALEMSGQIGEAQALTAPSGRRTLTRLDLKGSLPPHPWVLALRAVR